MNNYLKCSIITKEYGEAACLYSLGNGGVLKKEITTA